MVKINSKKDIIDAIESYGLALDDTYSKGEESYLLMCDAVTVNDICFRDVRRIHSVYNTMWIDNASITVEDVKNFHITFTSIKYDAEKCKIRAKPVKSFKLQ